MSGRIGIGIVGIGGISVIHEAAYQEDPRTKIVALCDTNKEVLKERAKQISVKAYESYQDLINDSEVEAIDVCLPHYLHHKVARYAIERGKNVQLEKPITMNYVDAVDLVNLAKEKGVKLSVSENTRFVKSYQQVKRLLVSGKIGEIWQVRTLIAGSEVERLSNKNGWIAKKEYGGGIVMDAGVHTFYLFKWLFGGLRSVQSILWNRIEGTEVEDNAIMYGILENGSQFQAQLSDTAQSPWTERLEIYGSGGAIISDQLSDPPLKIYNGWMDSEGEKVAEVEYNPAGWKAISIMDGIHDFVSAIVDDRPPTVDPSDAAYAVRIAEMAYSNSSMIQ
ncbi:MAG: Gfo/Idh/MocA family oxidoreductase [Candidatus Thermoplasmatota archaeon]|jgi:predicted dehydrogenase|nr:Gfo/Idh/MocA family oxidoreductase [Candidatus Thermoplasmatota archaeon]